MRRWAGPPRPGAVRTTLAVTAVALVALALRSSHENPWWWLAGGAVGLALLFGWWRCSYLTTLARRRLALFARNRGWRTGGSAPRDARTTVLLSVVSEPGGQAAGELPLPVLARYLNRYGIRCSAIRVTRRLPDRLTLVSLTIGVVENLAALQARSAGLPLRETAAVMRRRLADELHELGWTVQPVDHGGAPLEAARRPERWRCVPTGDGFVAAYRGAAVGALPHDVADLTAELEAEQVWTVLELTGDPIRPAVRLAYAVHTAERPVGRAMTGPMAGLIPEVGRQWPALRAMDPAATEPLAGPAMPMTGMPVEVRPRVSATL